MALFIGIDPDISRPSAAAVEVDLQTETRSSLGLLHPPKHAKLLSIALVRSSEQESGGFRPLTASERGIREVVRNLPIWLTQIIKHAGPVALACVEAMQPYFGQGRSPNLRSVISVSEMAGACAAVIRTYCGCEVLLPPTTEWKRSAPKAITHQRAYEVLGIETKPWKMRKNNSRPPFLLPRSGEVRQSLATLSPSPTNPGDWEDISDSVALALWVARQVQTSLAAQAGRVF